MDNKQILFTQFLVGGCGSGGRLFGDLSLSFYNFVIEGQGRGVESLKC